MLSRVIGKVVKTIPHRSMTIVRVDDPEFWSNVPGEIQQGEISEESSGKLVTIGEDLKHIEAAASFSARVVINVPADAGLNGEAVPAVIVMPEPPMQAGFFFQESGECALTGYISGKAVLPLPTTALMEHFPSLGITWKRTDNPAMQAFIGKKQGVIIDNPSMTAGLQGKLQSGDLLMEINGMPVAADGSVVTQDGR